MNGWATASLNGSTAFKTAFYEQEATQGCGDHGLLPNPVSHQGEKNLENNQQLRIEAQPSLFLWPDLR